MSVDMKIVNGTIVTSKRNFKGGIAIHHGKIVSIGLEEHLPEAAKVIDAHGNHILPGLIDAHVHFRDPGMEYKEDFSSASIAAAFGGITFACDMPNTIPVTDNESIVKLRKELIEQKSFIDIGLFGVVIPENIGKIESFAKSGIIGFKIYMGETVGKIASLNDGELFEAFEKITMTNLRAGFHAESNQLLQYFRKKVTNSERKNLEAAFEARPIVCELDSIQRIALFAKYTGAKVHILHLSSKEGAKIITHWKNKGVNITSETCPHYLFLSIDKEPLERKSLLLVNPPIRSSEDGEYLYNSLNEGRIDAITTDHAPHGINEKINEDIWEVYGGFIGVETSAQIMLSEALIKRGMSLNRFVEITSENPAKIWGLWPRKGSLQIGSDADITIVDLNKEWTIVESNLHSKHKITPWNNLQGVGKPISTIVRGIPIVIDEKFVVETPVGKLISPME